MKVLWMLRWDLLAVLVVAGLMMWLSDKVPFAGVAQIVPLMGVVVSIFIGFRNSSAYARWWEARTLWGTLASNARALSNSLIAAENPGASMAADADRMRRRQARHAYQLAAELRGIPPVVDVAALTPEDPAAASAAELMTLQAGDIHSLVAADKIDRQARSVLVNINTALTNAAGGLERTLRQPIPVPYDMFIRAVAWFFAIMVCTRLDTAGHDSAVGLVAGVLVMMLFVIAERFGHFIATPMADTPFGLPVDRFCADIAADLLGSADKLPTSKTTDSRLSEEK
ncbi:MAG TPA: bestrophin family ion channel [Mycobacterium sp.]|uniref:bestrophin family ion channel n=1 Tax=Mycolicibacterium sp. TaxID=2320850 RepID=UPI0025EC554F|nr:bestrophin family ion channel [Mycolicibacterium sp.]HPX36696.1 bestrophin family ion channel [Mycobacterium sp.]HQC76422.1 bestrophin family ion channel [Mycobacterium sp.]